MLIDQHPSLESLALVRHTWKMASEPMLHVPSVHHQLTSPAPVGSSKIDHRIFASAKYKMLKIVLVHRGIKSSRLQSSKLWPRKLKKMTLDFKDHAEPNRVYRADYPPIFRDADVIYRFVRTTVCHVPNQIWQK